VQFFELYSRKQQTTTATYLVINKTTLMIRTLRSGPIFAINQQENKNKKKDKEKFDAI